MVFSASPDWFPQTYPVLQIWAISQKQVHQWTVYTTFLCVNTALGLWHSGVPGDPQEIAPGDPQEKAATKDELV